MCEPKGSGGIGAVGVATAAGGAVVLWLIVKGSEPAPAPQPAPVVAHAPTPWLDYIAVASVAVVVTLAAVLLVVYVVRGRRTVVEAPPPVVRRPAPQRALEAAPIPAQAFLDGKVDA